MKKPGMHQLSPEDLVARFWSKVQRGAPAECWPFRSKSHGRTSFCGTPTARAAYQFSRGVIPEGHFVMHTCDNPPCCNPEHLCLGTPQDNVDDMMQKGRHRGNGWENKTHCKWGHEFTEENTLRSKDGHRRCQTCVREIKRRYSARISVAMRAYAAALE